MPNRNYISIDLLELFKKLLFILLLFLSAGVIYFAFRGVQGIIKARWNGRQVVNYLEVGEDYLVYAYHPREKILKGIRIPRGTMLPVAKGFGEYPIENIYQLGEMEEVGGGRLLAYSFQNFFKAPMDGWILKKGRRIPFLWESNFTWWDKLRIFWQTRSLKINKHQVVDLSEAGYLTEKKAADGSTIWKFREGSVYQVSLRVFGDQRVLSEALKVEVVNGTEHTLLAQRVAEMLKSVGVQVVSIGNSEKKYQKTQLIFSEKSKVKDSYTLKRLKEIFSSHRVEERSNLDADVQIIVSEDYWEKYYSSNN